jgi:hypothetical protein
VTTGRIIELAVAVAILVAGLWLYRRRVATDTGADAYGSQGAVILFVIAAIMGAHALGAMDYRPSQSELELMQDRAQ